MATTNPILKRREIKLGTFSQFSLPEFPKLPSSLVIRDPNERAEFDAKVQLFVNNLNTVLSASLSASNANPS